jgi:hypothetical protein
MQTYSMYGPPNSTSHSGQPNKAGVNRNVDQMGLIPRAIEEIFDLVHRRELADFQVHCSFVQIYNENLYDMLRYVNTHIRNCNAYREGVLT